MCLVVYVVLYCGVLYCDVLYVLCFAVPQYNLMQYSTNFWQGKTLANQLFQNLGKEMLADLQQITLPALVNYWRMMFVLPSFPLPKFCAIQYLLCNITL